MGIFSKRIKAAYQDQPRPTGATLAISSPWAPTSTLETFTADALGGITGKGAILTRDVALRVPGVKRAHGLICGQLAGIPYFQMDADVRTDDQPKWLTSSDSGVAPYHRMFGAASDWFFHGWACFGFTADMDDCLHIPYGHWAVDIDGTRTGTKGAVICDSADIPEKYKAHLVAVPLGFGENGLLVDGKDTINQARAIEFAYQNRLANPIPLTVLSIDDNLYFSYTPEQRAAIRDEWDEGRRKNSTALKPKNAMGVDLPGATIGTDLYETGRNAVRLDIANHTALPASAIEGVRQGGSGGGTEMRYQGVQNGGERSDLWEYGMARKMLLAFEARMSLDDIVPSGLSIRGDLSNMFATPNPDTNPTSED